MCFELPAFFKGLSSAFRGREQVYLIFRMLLLKKFFQKFMFYVLKTSDVLEILVPILYHINDSRNDPGKQYCLAVFNCFLLLLFPFAFQKKFC